MKTELIIVGTELLLGQIVNTNGAYLSKELADLGYEVYFETTVGDNKKRLLETLTSASHRSELVVLCGGLGPTTDDLTKETVSEFINQPLEYDEPSLEKIYHLFSSTNRTMPENNRKQALTFKKGTTLKNPTGLACGVLIESNNINYLLLPGPPSELTVMFEEQAKPLLKKISPYHKELISRYLHFIDIGESQLAADLSDVIDSQTNPAVAPYAKSNEVMLRLTAQSSNVDTANQLLDEMEHRILAREKEYFYGYGEDLTIQEVTIQKLMEKNATLSVIDLVTEGQFFAQGSSVASSEDVLKAGIDVNDVTIIENIFNDSFNSTNLEKLGEQLALQGLNKFKTDYVFSVVADLSKADEDLPEGIIWFCLASHKKVLCEKRVIKRHLSYVKEGALKHGYNFIRKNI